jgi:hypothetical protein
MAPAEPRPAHGGDAGEEDPVTAPYTTSQVIPRELAEAVDPLPYWFVIGGQAVRCFAPYRPSRHVDFGIGDAADLQDLVAQLSRKGRVEIQERGPDTVHLLYDGIKVSVFVVPHLAAHAEDRHLDVAGILATKLHAVLDRGLRRDFFDLYVMLQQHRLGIAAMLGAIPRPSCLAKGARTGARSRTTS